MSSRHPVRTQRLVSLALIGITLLVMLVPSLPPVRSFAQDASPPSGDVIVVLKEQPEGTTVAAEAKAAGESSMSCPRCTGKLVEMEFEGVMIDRCDNCSGIWLDPGEFSELVKKDTTGWFHRWWGGE